MKRAKFILFALLLSTASYAEQSVYTNSDFVDPESMAKKNSRDILILKQQIAQLKEKIEGLNTIIQGQSNEIAALRQKSNNNFENILNQLSQRVAALESRAQQQRAAIIPATAPQNRAGVVQKSEKKAVADTTKSKESFDGLSSRELFKKSVLNFTKSRLTKAKSGFTELLKRGYKKASDNFYLGEIAFKRGHYKEAISRYQQSATLDENANYMDKLLLHTAKALKSIGKAGEAKVFFKAVVDSYPDSSSAKEAKRYLGKY